MSKAEVKEATSSRRIQLNAAVMQFEDMKRKAVGKMIDEACIDPTEAQQRVDGVYEEDPDIDLSDLPPPPDFDGAMPGAKSGKKNRISKGGSKGSGKKESLKWGIQEDNEGKVQPIKGSPGRDSTAFELGQRIQMASLSAASEPEPAAAITNPAMNGAVLPILPIASLSEAPLLTRAEMEEKSTGPSRPTASKQTSGEARGLRTQDSGARRKALEAKKKKRESLESASK
jgi:hypothetical protein